MTTINDTYINALLADASYVSNLDQTTTPGQLAAALTGRMTPELAKYVSDNFTVVTQASGFASSFEATVWRGNAGTPYAGQIYVSTRGTQEGPDFAADSTGDFKKKTIPNCTQYLIGSIKGAVDHMVESAHLLTAANDAAFAPMVAA